MRPAALASMFLLVAACAVGQGIDPDATVATRAPTSTTAAVDAEARLDALDVTGRLVEAILGRDGAVVASLAADPPATIQEDIDRWADAIGMVDGTYTVVAEAFTATTAQIDVRLELELVEVGRWVYTTTVDLVGGGPWTALWSARVLHPSLEVGDILRVDRDWPERGAILAHDGTELAGAEPVKVIGVVPAWIEDLDALTAQLTRLAGIAPDHVVDEISRPGVQPDWFVPVGSMKLVVHAAVGSELEALPGVVLRDGSERLPFRSAFASHVVGTTGPITAEQLDRLGFPYGPTDTVGRSGIELTHERRLAGRPRTAIVRVNRFGRVMEELLVIEALQPEPVHTTIDIDVQTAVEQALRGEERAVGVVVLDAATGEVRATASRPLSDGFDRALLGTYPPGSTFKVVTAAALVESRFSAATEVDCPAEVTLGGRSFRNAAGLALGTISFTDAFAVSCNTAFAASAVAALDASTLEDVASRFGFGIEPELGVPSATPRFPTPVDTVELAAAAIGQGRVLVTPVHMASIAAAVASGTWRPPTLLAVAEPATGVPLEPATGTVLADLMLEVVRTGTGTAAAVSGVDVRGKTGSAEFGTGDDLGEHAWFIAFWDGMAIAVVVEGGGAGGTTAAPIAREIIADLAG